MHFIPADFWIMILLIILVVAALAILLIKKLKHEIGRAHV